MSTKSPVFLVTGACGLIGSATIRRLNSLGHTHILAVDKLGSSPHKWKTLSSLRFHDYLEFDEFCGGKAWKTALEGVDTVIHLGAKSATTEQNAAFLIENNYGFSQWLAEWCEEHGARFVYASSAATYGADSVMDDTRDLDYLETLRPLNAYGYSKHLFDLWMARQGYLDRGGLLTNDGAVGLKYTNVYGYPESHKGDQRSLVVKAYDALRNSRPIELYESPRKDVPTESIARDFLHVSDAAKVTVWFALDEIGRKASGLYNVGSGKARSFVDLAKATAEAYTTVHKAPKIIRYEHMARLPSGLDACYGREFDMEPPYIRYVPMPENLRGRYQYFTQAPIAKLRKAGYSEDFLSLEEGVRKTVGEMVAEEGN